MSEKNLWSKLKGLLQLNDLHSHVRIGLRARHHFGLATVKGSTRKSPQTAYRGRWHHDFLGCQFGGAKG
jgi:hypothetical protein